MALQSTRRNDGGYGSIEEDQSLLDATVKKNEYLDESKLTEEECRNQTNLWRMESIGILACYLTVGLCQGLSRPLLNVYPLDLGATEGQQATVGFVTMIPATMKIIYGFISDNVPIWGLRRKPYMWMGWTLVSSIMVSLLVTSDLSMSYMEQKGSNNQDNNPIPIPPPNAPSIGWLSICFLLFGNGMWLADVMGDSFVAEKARLEPEDCKGRLQSSCYASRFFGMMVGAPVASFLYSTYGPKAVVQTLALIPLFIMFPLMWLLYESNNVYVPSTKSQCIEIWNTICSRSVWQPLAFAYLFNLLQVQNAAWRQFLRSVLGFTSAQLNSLLVVSYVFLFLGILLYKNFFLKTSWRRVYQFCIVLNGFFTVLQLALISGDTLGLSSFWFALGDDAAQEFVVGIQFLPLTIMLVALCPKGSEGASYAIFTTSYNCAVLLAPTISTMLLTIWDVDEGTLLSGDLDGLRNLTILTAAIQTSPIIFLGWLPRTREELYALSSATTNLSRSRWGGIIFLAIMTFSMVYVLGIGILNIAHPGWSGAS